jgi:3-hydroxyisobutyrate dehydrogenase-like beta-hydroxyacid dehydrogenase
MMIALLGTGKMGGMARNLAGSGFAVTQLESRG